MKVKWVWRILTTWYDPKRNQWLSTWWHLLKLRCSLYTSQDIEDVVVVGYSNNKMKVMTISFLWVSLEQWGVHNGIVSLIYLEQPRLDFPVFSWGCIAHESERRSMIWIIFWLPHQQPRRLRYSRAWKNHTFNIKVQVNLIFNVPWLSMTASQSPGCSQPKMWREILPPHPLSSVQHPLSRYSNVKKSSKSQVLFISICFINSATHIPPPRHLSPNVSTSVRIFGSAEVRHTTMGTLSGF